MSPTQKTLGLRGAATRVCSPHAADLPSAATPPPAARVRAPRTTHTPPALYFFSLEVPLGFHARRAHRLRETRVHRAWVPTSGRDRLPTNFPSLGRGRSGEGAVPASTWGWGGSDSGPRGPRPPPGPLLTCAVIRREAGRAEFGSLGVGRSVQQVFGHFHLLSKTAPRADGGAGEGSGAGVGAAPAGCEGRGASASGEPRASAEREGGRRAGWGRRRPNLSHSNSAPQRSPPAPGCRRRRRRPRPPHPLPASRARHSAAGAPRRPSRPPRARQAATAPGRPA